MVLNFLQKNIQTSSTNSLTSVIPVIMVRVTKAKTKKPN